MKSKTRWDVYRSVISQGYSRQAEDEPNNAPVSFSQTRTKVGSVTTSKVSLVNLKTKGRGRTVLWSAS